MGDILSTPRVFQDASQAADFYNRGATGSIRGGGGVVPGKPQGKPQGNAPSSTPGGGVKTPGLGKFFTNQQIEEYQELLKAEEKALKECKKGEELLKQQFNFLRSEAIKIFEENKELAVKVEEEERIIKGQETMIEVLNQRDERHIKEVKEANAKIEGLEEVFKNNCEKGQSILDFYYKRVKPKRSEKDIEGILEKYMPSNLINETGICAANAALQLGIAVTFHYLTALTTTLWQKNEFINQMLVPEETFGNTIMRAIGFADGDLTEAAAATCMGDHKGERGVPYFQAAVEKASPLRKLLAMPLFFDGEVTNGDEILPKRTLLENAKALVLANQNAFIPFSNALDARLKHDADSETPDLWWLNFQIYVFTYINREQMKDTTFKLGGIGFHFEEEPEYILFRSETEKNDERLNLTIDVPVKGERKKYHFLAAYVRQENEFAKYEHAVCYTYFKGRVYKLDNKVEGEEVKQMAVNEELSGKKSFGIDLRLSNDLGANTYQVELAIYSRAGHQSTGDSS